MLPVTNQIFTMSEPTMEQHMTATADLLPATTTTTTSILITGFFPGCKPAPEGKPFWILLEQEMMGWQ